jgi:prephenate dehydrogenase
MRIAVLGVGLIGGSIGLAAKERVPGAEVIGYGRNGLDEALARGAVDRSAASIAEAVADAEVVFACAPVDALVDQVNAALAAAPADTVLSDVGSTKAHIAGQIDDQRFVGGHPVAGAEVSGVGHARADLFEGAAWYLTPRPDTSGLLYERLHRLVVALGARPSAIDAETHDKLLAAVSHVPHVLANVLVAEAAEAVALGEPLPRAGPSFRDATRVAGASSNVWTGIYMTNREAIAAELDSIRERLGRVAATLRSGDDQAIRVWNDLAADDRRRLLEADFAGGQVLELRLNVPNQPGIVAQVALALGKAGVNIVDLALAPAPDMRSGAMTIWVTGEGAAGRARTLIEELGFPTAIVAP